MQTKLSRICDAIIEAGWLAALIVAPLFFDTFSNRVFEPDKIHLVRSIALVMAVAWIVQLLDVGLGGRSSAQADGQAAPGLWTRIRGTPLMLPALVLVAVYLLSTALSVVPDQPGRLLRADAGRLQLPELHRHLRHDPDTSAQPRSG